MKKSLLKLAGVALLALSVAAISKADNITGEIDLSQFGSTASVNFTTDVVSFNPTTTNALVGFATGDYAGLLGAHATYNSFSYAPGAGNQTVWTLTSDPLDYFVLTQITIVQVSTSAGQNVGLSLWGQGIAYLDGKTPTFGEWTFSSSTTTGNTSFNFSSTNTSAPDGGTTALLVGFGLVGMSFVARRRK